MYYENIFLFQKTIIFKTFFVILWYVHNTPVNKWRKGFKNYIFLLHIQFNSFEYTLSILSLNNSLNRTFSPGEVMFQLYSETLENA